MSRISSKYQKDYKNLDYKNPRLMRDKQKRRAHLLKFLGIILALGALTLVYCLFFSAYFKIKTIEINGLEKIKKANIERLINDYRSERKWFVLARNNFWFFNKTQLRDKIYRHYYFEEFQIKKRLPDRVIINLQEKESAINWLTNNLCYHLDLTGQAIEYCEESGGLLKIKDIQNQELEIGGQAVDVEILSYIVNLNRQILRVGESKFNILLYEKEYSILRLRTEQGFAVLFNLNLTVNEQVARLDLILNQEGVRDNLEGVNYIDLRFGEKVYYK